MEHNNEYIKRFMLITGLCLIALASIHWLARPLIQQNQTEAALKLLLETLPVHLRSSLNETHLQELQTSGISKVTDKCDSALLVQTITQGYSGPLKVITSLVPDTEVLVVNGVRVIPPHKETPGLGDKIEPRVSDWIHQFTQWPLQKVDSISGATISTNAVIKAFNLAIKKGQTLSREMREMKHECAQ